MTPYVDDDMLALEASVADASTSALVVQVIVDDMCSSTALKVDADIFATLALVIVDDMFLDVDQIAMDLL